MWKDAINIDKGSKRRDPGSDSIRDAAISEFEFISRSSDMSARRRTHPTGRGDGIEVDLCRKVEQCRLSPCGQLGCLQDCSTALFPSGVEPTQLSDYRVSSLVQRARYRYFTFLTDPRNITTTMQKEQTKSQEKMHHFRTTESKKQKGYQTQPHHVIRLSVSILLLYRPSSSFPLLLFFLVFYFAIPNC